MESDINQSACSRAWDDTKSFFHRLWWFWSVEVGVMGTFAYLADEGYLIPQLHPALWTAIGAGIAYGCIFLFNLGRAPYRQRDEARLALKAIPGATPDSPRVASLELHYEDFDYKFIGDNPPLLQIQFGVMPTGTMHLEQAVIEILGEKIPFADWETCTVSPSVTFGFTNRCEIKDKLATGEHDIRILIFANREWWASDWQTITYSPLVLDKKASHGNK